MAQHPRIALAVLASQAVACGGAWAFQASDAGGISGAGASGASSSRGSAAVPPSAFEDMARRLEALEKRNSELQQQVVDLKAESGQNWLTEERAAVQEIRPLRVAILNLMPTKIATETQLLRLLGNSALQVEITLLQTATYQARHTDASHMLMHYVSFEQVRDQRFDGLIITGAPVEHLPFEAVDYWGSCAR